MTTENQAPEGGELIDLDAIAEEVCLMTGNCLVVTLADAKAAVEAALAAPAPQAPAWQPIETAPKDGRDLLLWESGSYVPFVGAWRDGRRPGWHCDTEHYNTDGNACVISNLWQEGVTHWMPLPAAPQTKEPTNDR